MSKAVLFHKLFRINIQNIMKRFLIGILLMITLSGCYTTTFFLDSPQHLYEGSSNAKTNNESLTLTSYSDEYITIYPYSDDPQIYFTLVNNHSSSIRIIWDDAVYIDYSGSAHHIIHKDVKFINKGDSQVASIVPKNAKIEEVITPIECVNLTDGQWTITPFESNIYKTKWEAEAAINTYIANPFLRKDRCTLVLPIEIDGKIIEYTLKFIGDEYRIKATSEYDQYLTESIIGIISVTALLTFAVLMI